MKKLSIFMGAALLSTTAYAADWSYKGETGADKWGSLKAEFATCDTGRLQSPFNIEKTFTAENLPELELSYDDIPLTVSNNGQTLQVDIADDRSMMVGDEKYKLLQFHFHTPSEYQLNGESFALDLHFVHKREDGELGVLGVFLKEGAENETMAKILEAAPKEKGKKGYKDASLSLKGLLPSDMSYVRFMGSLTTPPCSEDVNWHVLTTPVEMSKVQIDAFKALFPMNARPLQPANNRLVVGE